MFKTSTVTLIILIVCLFYFTSDKVPSVINTVDYNLLAAEGMIGIDVLVNENNNSIPTPTPTPQVRCGGTGRIKTPDGVSWMKCPGCQDCQNSGMNIGKLWGQTKEYITKYPIPTPRQTNNFVPANSECDTPITPEITQEPPTKRLLFFTAKWCTFCQKFKDKDMPEMINKGWQNFITTIDADEHPELVTKYNIKALPAFVYEDEHGNMVDKIEGYASSDKVSTHWYEVFK